MIIPYRVMQGGVTDDDLAMKGDGRSFTGEQSL
jgi:hypothetical protein